MVEFGSQEAEGELAGWGEVGWGRRGLRLGRADIGDGGKRFIGLSKDAA